MYHGNQPPGIPGETFKIPENPRPRGILKTGEISNPTFKAAFYMLRLKKSWDCIELALSRAKRLEPNARNFAGAQLLSTISQRSIENVSALLGH